MRALAFGVACAVAGGASAAAADEPALDAALTRAAVYVVQCAERLALVRASENYVQHLSVATKSGGDGVSVRWSRQASGLRTLVSDVLFVPSDDAVFAFYRDVSSVDGKAVRNKEERLLRLFPEGPTASGRAKAAEILNESARFNLGSAKRNTSVPTLALTLLHARNQGRFAFRAKGETRIAGLRALEIEFSETAHPTLVRSSAGDDVGARGTLVIALESGALLRSDLRFDSIPARIQVRYLAHPTLGVFVPEEMSDVYGSENSVERIDGLAKYADYKRGDAEIGPIRYR